MSRHYALDSIVVRGSRIFGWGFCLDVQRPLRVRSLRVPLEGGGSIDIDVHASGSRPDLGQAFPLAPHAEAAGFMVAGRLPSGVARGTAELILEDSQETLLLPNFPEAYQPAMELPVHRGWVRLRAIAQQRGWASAFLAATAGLVRRLGTFIREYSPAKVQTEKGVVVVIDHRMGGGANRYRETRLEALRTAGAPVALVTSDFSSLSYRLELFSATALKVDRRFEDQADLIRMIESMSPAAIEINSLVGCDDVSAMLAAIVGMRRRRPMLRFRFNLHDFHSLCPSFTLMDKSGEYCGVPRLDTCRACLPANSRFSLGMNVGINIVEWRRAWSEWLMLADERVAFSKSSLDIFSLGMPEVASLPWRVEPHVLDRSHLRPVVPRLDSPTAVVAVGHLNYAKGAEFFGALARRAEERQLPLRFAVIGTVEGGAVPSSVAVRGAFRREQLCELLEAEGTCIALLPSICPETYSYVTDELMATGLPIAVLDLGAPAERVARYHSGLVLPRAGVDAQLDILVAFARRLGAHP